MCALLALRPVPVAPRAIIALSLALILTGTGIAQQAAPLSPHAGAARKTVAALAPDAHISVLPVHGEEAFGAIASHTDIDFTFHDVDDNIDVTLKYEDVKKIRKGYGGRNLFSGRHTDPQKGRIVTLVVVGGVIGGLLLAVAMARN